jgi:3-dehydroquinate synthase
LKKLKVIVEGGRGYDVLVGHNTIKDIGKFIKPLNIGNSVFIITSPKIGGLYLKSLIAGLRNSDFKNIKTVYVPDGEKNKNIKWYDKVINALAEYDASQNGEVFVINLGGGVIGDLGGFVAATYKRGMGADYIQVPTTLLACVDCGIGGKVGINLNTFKNMQGAFYQPKLVFADLNILKTLNKRELKSGFAEIIKYGVIHSQELFEYIENNINKIFSLDKQAINKIVMESYTIKADLVKKDERDTGGIRIKLNYGHTIGHAVEAASKYAYRHGEAISIGMVCVNDISVRLGLLDKSVAARIENLVIKAGLPNTIGNCSLKDIMHYLKLDKKFVNGENRFVLATKIGKVTIKSNISENVITNVIKNRFTK